MALLSRSVAYDRSRLLLAAERARSRRRFRRAIRLYRQVLAMEPGNWDVHSRVAPLLARTRRRFDAWLSFRAAARGYLRDGQVERALEEYRRAVEHLPRQLEAWLAIAELERKRGRAREAVQALIAGRRRQRGSRRRSQAIYLLRRVREIEPWHIDALHDLARLLAQTKQRDEALLLLDTMAERAGGRLLRRIRSTSFRVSPTPRNAWLWLRAALLWPPRAREARLNPPLPIPHRPLLTSPLHAAHRIASTPASADPRF